MIRLDWAILAQGYAVDRASSALSIFNVIEEISIPAAVVDAAAAESVALGPPLSVIVQWSGQAESETSEAPHVRVRLQAPDGGVLAVVEIPRSTDRVRRYRTIATFGAFPFHGLGTYTFSVEVEREGRWRRVGQIPLDVRRIPAVNPQPQAANS